MKNKEHIYDEQIAPLMAKIIEICKFEQIPMFAEFQYADLDFCTTCIYPDVDGKNVTIKLYDVLSKCRIEEGVNIDQFFFHLAKNYPNKSSIVMNILGNKPVSEQSGMNKYEQTSAEVDKALSIGGSGNCDNHQTRRCMHCNYKWAYHLYFSAQSNAAKCPNCGGLMTNIVDKL